MESQPFLGLLPERRNGFVAIHRGHLVTAWPDLVGFQIWPLAIQYRPREGRQQHGHHGPQLDYTL
jgi:hypothetical protein